VAAVSAAPKSGLGRGLAAILPTAESSEKEQLSDQQRVLHSLVDAGLDQLGAAAKLDLLAYLHLPRHDEPVLFLRTPPLATLSATRAYRLFARFAQASRSGANDGTFTQDGIVTVFVRTPGAAADGVHFFGRAESVIEQATLPTLRATAHIYATICNQYAAGTPDDLGTPRLVVEIADAGTTVRIAEGPGHRDGEAKADDPQEAVVRAVLASATSALTYRDAREVLLGTARAVLVVLGAADGTPRPGFVVSEDDLLQATATATMRAITGR
jgi:hypothetical protein